MLRRLVDIVVSASALALLSPVLALAALAVRLESRGPVIYRRLSHGTQSEDASASSNAPSRYR